MEPEPQELEVELDDVRYTAQWRDYGDYVLVDTGYVRETREVSGSGSKVAAEGLLSELAQKGLA